MVILTIKTKEFKGIGPANGYPSEYLACIFEDEDTAREYLKGLPQRNIEKARIYGGYGEDRFVRDMRKSQ